MNFASRRSRGGWEKVPSHLFSLTTGSQWKRDSIGNDGKEVKCPGRAEDLRVTQEKRRKMQRDLGASGASEPYAGTVDGQGHEARTSCPLEAEQDTSALLQMDVVRAAEDRASRRIS